MDPIGLRINAVTKLSTLVSDNKQATNWDQVAQYSVLKHDWDRAQGAILQLKLISAGAPKQLRRVEFYTALLEAVKTDDHAKVISVFDTAPATDEYRSGSLVEILKAAKSKLAEAQPEAEQ